MAATKHIIRQIEKFADEIKKSGIGLRRVILFGSYAVNKQKKYSDVDIALVADNFKGIDFFDIGLFAAILSKYSNLLLQPRTYNTSQFSAEKDPLVEEILKTGIEIKI
jgi:predicted nucleotidyltransferase